MATVFDIAAYIKSRIGDPGRMRMNKLAYYVQAWSLVWRAQPAFAEEIQAWKDGPVVKDLWVDQQHGASSLVDRAHPLPPDLQAHVDRVLVYYGHMSGDHLSKLTHEELPWRAARGSLPDNVPSDAPITHDLMLKHFGHRWAEAERDNAAASGTPAFRGSVDAFEAFIAGR